MTLFPAGIEIFTDKRVGPFYDSFSAARGVLHQKLVAISCKDAIFAIPRRDLFSQVGLVVDELLEFEDFDLNQKEQTILSRVLAYDLMASQSRESLISRLIN
ncbi:MAG: hypothetical protein V3R64_00830 [Sphingomonadales bacterium]